MFWRVSTSLIKNPVRKLTSWLLIPLWLKANQQLKWWHFCGQLNWISEWNRCNNRVCRDNIKPTWSAALRDREPESPKRRGYRSLPPPYWLYCIIHYHLTLCVWNCSATGAWFSRSHETGAIVTLAKKSHVYQLEEIVFLLNRTLI